MSSQQLTEDNHITPTKTNVGGRGSYKDVNTRKDVDTRKDVNTEKDMDTGKDVGMVKNVMAMKDNVTKR